mgnify:CR=1 FL=1
MPDIFPPESLDVTTGPLPASRKIHVAGTHHPDIRVAMREIAVDPSANEPPLRVYDTSGPYTDPLHPTDIRRGLPALRAGWIDSRGDVEAYEGRDPKPASAAGSRPYWAPRSPRGTASKRAGTTISRFPAGTAGSCSPRAPTCSTWVASRPAPAPPGCRPRRSCAGCCR